MNQKLAIIALCVAGTFGASAQNSSELNRAMLSGYEEILAANPKDYLTLYERAAQYYYLSKYDEAFIDIIKALQYTPEKDKGMMVQELNLLADISVQQKDYQRAYDAVERILAIDPDSYATVYKKGNICLHLDRLDEAYRAFASMQRLKSHSQESYFGMAQAAMRMGKTDDVESLIKQAQESNPNSALTYCRVGDLYRELNQPQKAATNYLVAINLGNGVESRPIDALVAMSRENFTPVAQALDYAATVSQTPASMYYLKGHLAYSTGHYEAAREALSKLILTPQGLTGEPYRMLAESELALGNLDAALTHLAAGMAMDSNTDMLKSQARVQMAKGNWLEAAMDLSQVVEQLPEDAEAQILFARTLIETGNPKRAVDVLGTVLLDDADNLDALLLRGWIKENKLKDRQGAAQDYTRAGNVEGEDIADIVKRCIGKSKAGRQLDADAIVADLVKNAKTPDTYYWAGVYYAQTANPRLAKEMVNKAVAEGYENMNLIKLDTTPLLSVAPMRTFKAKSDGGDAAGATQRGTRSKRK